MCYVISLSSQKQVSRAIKNAQSVLLTAYMLRPGRMLDALEDAARRGARVTVRLEGRPYADATGELAATNRAAIKVLRRLGADAKLADTNARNGPALHMKAAICDGVAYLDDRNWPGRGDTIVRDDFRADVAAIESAALQRRADHTQEFWTNKRDALWAERRLLAGATNAKPVDVESESFGTGSGAYGALKLLARSGVACRLVVARRDLNDKSKRALASLAQAGVAVRVSDCDEKMAIVDRTRAWTGSANATSSYANGVIKSNGVYALMRLACSSICRGALIRLGTLRLFSKTSASSCVSSNAGSERLSSRALRALGSSVVRQAHHDNALKAPRLNSHDLR